SLFLIPTTTTTPYPLSLHDALPICYYTTLPNKLFEYVMAEVPVLGSDSPGIGKVVAETGVGEVVDPVDPVSLADATRKILADPEDRKSTRLNSSHVKISYAVFCLKK